MALPCIYTYKGEEYSPAEFRAKLATELYDEVAKPIVGGEPIETKIPKESPKLVGVTNEATKQMLKSLDIDPVAKSIQKSNPEVWNGVIKEVENGLDVKVEVQRIIQTVDPLINKRVQAIVLMDRIKTLNEHDAIQKDLSNAIEKNDLVAKGDALIRLEQNKIDITNNAIADTKIGGQWGDFGQFRQQLASREYDLVAIERKAKNANDGNRLSNADNKEFAELAEKHSELQKTYKDLLEKHQAETEKFAEQEKELKDKLAIEILNKAKEKAAKKIVSRKPSLTAEQVARKTQLKSELMGRLNDVTSMAALLADKKFYEYSGLLFKEAAGDFSHFAKEVGESFSKIAKEDIPLLWEKLGGKKESVEESTSIKDKLVEKADGELNENIKGLIDKRVYEIVQSNMDVKIDEVVDIIADDLKNAIPDLDKSELKDLITGYGKFKELSKDEVQKQVSEIKLQGRLDSALTATEQGELPLRNGLQRAEQTQETREKRAKIAKNIKEKNLVSPLTEQEVASRYKTDIEAHHRRLENAIADVQKEIEDNQRKEKAQGKKYTDEKSQQLNDILSDLKKQRDEVLPKTETNEQKVKRISKSIESSIEKVQAQIKALQEGKGVVEQVSIKSKLGEKIFGFKKKVVEIKDPHIEKLKNIKASFEADLSELIPEYVKDKALLDKYKKGREKRLQFLEERLKKGDFTPKPRVKPLPTEKLDADTKQILIDIRRTEQKINDKIEELRIENMNSFQKAIIDSSKLHRFNIFFGAKSMVKLTFAALSRPTLKLPNEIAQFVLSNTPGIKEGIMQKSITHYNPSPFKSKSFVKYFTTYFADSETVKNAYQEFKDKSDWNIEHTTHEGLESNTILDKPQKLHGALKTFPKIAQFKSSLQRGMETLATSIDPNTGQYYDITKPEVQQMAIEGAKQDALADIYMNDVEVSKAIKNGIDLLKRSDKAGVQALSLAIEQELPVIKVPINFYAEVLEKTPILGTIKALGIIKRAGELGAKEQGKYPGGIKNLTPEQARNTAKALENQIVGAIGLAVGASLYSAYGDDTKKMLRKALLFTHNAFTDLVDMGVEWAELATQGEEDKKTKEKHAVPISEAGAKAIAKILKEKTKELPPIKAAKDITKIFQSDDALSMKAAGMISSLVEPNVMKEIAVYIDKDANGEPVVRTAKDWKETLMLPVPGLRQKVETDWDRENNARIKSDTQIGLIKNEIQSELRKSNTDNGKVKLLMQKINNIKKEKIEKSILDEENFIELGKALGKEAYQKKGLSGAALHKVIQKEGKYKKPLRIP